MQLREELASVTDSSALIEREAETITRAKISREDPMLHIELGFVAQRLGEITGTKQHYDDAASEFEWATELRPDWPYPWYGLGLAEMAIGESQNLVVENLKQMLGKDYLSKAAGAFGRAAKSDPAFAQAVIDLARTALRQRVRARLEVARDALREAAATAAAGSAELQLARGRIEREAADGDSALVAFQRYLQVGGDSGVGMVEVARTYFYLDRPTDGLAAYEAAAKLRLSPEATALERSDLAWIALPSELASFDSLPPGGHTAWLAAFWARRDAADGRRRGERLAEHYRRYFYALHNYRLVSVHRRYDITERFHSDQQEVDDRGVIYLRHGEPNRRATFIQPSIEPNESWLYVEPDGDRIFHFVARNDVQDYKLVESLADALGLRTALALEGGAGTGPAAALFESRSGLDPRYQRLASLSPSVRATALAEERARGRKAIRAGTTRDSYGLRFAHPLKPVVREMAVAGGGDSGENRLLVSFAISGAHLLPFTRGATIVYPVALRVVAERSDGLIRTLDTLRTFAAGRRLDARDQLTGLLQIAVPPGTYRLRVVFSQPGTDAGAVTQDDSVDVPSLDANHPGLSDIVLGRRGEGPLWLTGGDSVPVSALASFPEGSDLSLYFEVHGVPRGERYHTRIEVVREGGGGLLGLFRGNRTSVSLEYDGASVGEPTRVLQTLNVGTLSPGRYRLVVRAELRPGDARHTREISFTVVPRKPT
ncbi:MAG: GWxTD domain-containing protein [Gemmatimonadetes bacterium]|nr:GWxTD domain-containing protein [Gemmatimonadota bacterium]